MKTFLIIFLLAMCTPFAHAQRVPYDISESPELRAKYPVSLEVSFQLDPYTRTYSVQTGYFVEGSTRFIGQSIGQKIGVGLPDGFPLQCDPSILRRDGLALAYPVRKAAPGILKLATHEMGTGTLIEATCKY
jgi:hypothetical protein